MGFNPLLTTRPNGPSEKEATARYRTTAPDSSYTTVMAVEGRAIAEELSQEVEEDLREQGLGSNEPDEPELPSVPPEEPELPSEPPDEPELPPPQVPSQGTTMV